LIQPFTVKNPTTQKNLIKIRRLYPVADHHTPPEDYIISYDDSITSCSRL